VIDAAVRKPIKHERRVGLADAFDAGPPVVWIGLSQIRQFDVDGVSVDIDESSAGGSVSFDGRAPRYESDG
jgi:hypothetical protein